MSGEESPSQIKMRGDRIGITNQQCYIIAETEVEKALSKARSVGPELIVIDSIQTMFSHLIDSLESVPPSFNNLQNNSIFQ